MWVANGESMWDFSEFGFMLLTVGSKTTSNVEEGTYVGWSAESQHRRIYCQCSLHCHSVFILCRWPPNFEQSACEMSGGHCWLPWHRQNIFVEADEINRFLLLQDKRQPENNYGKPHILAWRHRYLRQVWELSASGRPIVFLDETWVNAHHYVGRKWYSDSSKAGDPIPKEAPTGKGKRLNILHAGL